MSDEKATDEGKSDISIPVDNDDSSAETLKLQTIIPAIPETIPIATQDGGTRAWLQVVGSFLVFSNLWGFNFAFGAFQSYYQLTYLPTETASTISWIGTISSFLLILVGVISGPLFDTGHFKAMLFVGAAMQTIGLFMLSLSTKYYQIILTQGVLIGIGCGLLYLPGLALTGRSFKKHRQIAMALVTCGAPTGGIVYTLMFQQLIGRLGFAWTIRAMGFFMLGTYLMSFPLLLWRAHNVGDLASGTKRKLFDVAALKDIPFWSYSISNFLLFTGYLVPFIFIASYGQTELGMSESMSLTLVMIAQAASVAGRLITGFLASRIGSMLPWITCALTSGIIAVAWIGVKTEASFITIAVLYGAFSGALIPLPPSVFPIVCPDLKVLGARLGMAQAIGSVASLIGSPIAGALTQISSSAENRYLGLQLFSGLVMICGGISLMGLWALLLKKRDVVGKWI